MLYSPTRVDQISARSCTSYKENLSAKYFRDGRLHSTAYDGGNI